MPNPRVLNKKCPKPQKCVQSLHWNFHDYTFEYFTKMRQNKCKMGMETLDEFTNVDK